MIENIGHDIKTENTFEEYPIEEATFNNFYIDEQNEGKRFYWAELEKHVFFIMRVNFINKSASCVKSKISDEIRCGIFYFSYLVSRDTMFA